MNLLKEIFAHEVYPALGCTEPSACAYAAAIAAFELGEPFEKLVLRVDPGTYKNGNGVTVPCTDGAKGNLIAAVVGAIIAKPVAKLEVLKNANSEILAKAKEILRNGHAKIDCANTSVFFIEIEMAGAEHKVTCVLEGGHTSIKKIEKDGRLIFPLSDRLIAQKPNQKLDYREALRRESMIHLLRAVENLDDDDIAFLKRGIEMNLSISELGKDAGKTASQLSLMHRDGIISDDMFFRTKLVVAAAVDARMSGAEHPVMTSGGSGNQGIVAILTPYCMGKERGIHEKRILQSIALAHVTNAYIKCYLGELSVICGCAMAAGVASAAAIVYQQAGLDSAKLTLAVNNVIGDLGGLICDGAKSGCAMKCITSVDAAIRAAMMALRGYGLNAEEGMVSSTIEDSIKNIARISLEGMNQVDPTLLKILKEKNETCSKVKN